MVTDKQLRDIVFETIREVLLAEITAMRQDMRELRQCSRESLLEIRAMRLEFRRNMDHLNRQLDRLARMVEEKLSDEDAADFFSESNPSWPGKNWQASAGSGLPAKFEREFSYSEMQTRLSQMEHRLGILEKALQRN
jgi:hypothetical protein